MIHPYTGTLSAMKRSKLVVHERKGMTLKGILLNEKAKCERAGSVYMAFGKRQNWIEEKQINHCQGIGGGEGLTLNWYVETLRNHELVLYFYCGGGYRTVMY